MTYLPLDVKQPTINQSYQMQTTRYSHNYNENTLEVDWACPTKRPGGHHKNSTPLDPEGKIRGRPIMT